MKDQLFRLNGLRADFMKWADSNEPSTWEIEVNKIGGNITGYTSDYTSYNNSNTTSGHSFTIKFGSSYSKGYEITY